MKIVHREGVDIDIVFSSGAKRFEDGMPQSMNSKDRKKRLMNFYSYLPLALRETARFAIRLPKAPLQHIKARFRRTVTDETRLAIQQEIQRTSAVTLQKANALMVGLLSRLDQIEKISGEMAQKQESQLASLASLQETNALVADLLPRLDRIENISSAAARRFAINCGHGEILVRTSVGYVLCAATDHSVLACLIDTGELELGTRLLIERFLKPGEVFVDVGANLGMHTLAAARAMQGRGRIIAFEPYKPTKLLLEKSVWLNGFSEITEVHQAAVSNTAGHKSLFLGATSGHHSLYPLDVTGEISLKPVKVPLVRLDGVVPAGHKVDLIKIDAEGAELDVLESATELIKGSPDVALIVEFGPSHLKRTGHTTQEWFDAFAKLGLNYRAINSNTGALEDWSLEKLENAFSVNLFFARKDSDAWERTTT